MEARSVGGNEAAKKISKLYDDVDGKKIERLEMAQLFHVIKKEMMEAESKRVTKKYGTKHARSEKAVAAIQQIKNISEALDMQLKFTKMNSTPFSTTSWSVQGFVTRESGKGVPGLLVSFITEKRKTANLQWTSKTDENGFYSLLLEKEALEKLASQPLFLIVMSKAKKLIQQGENALLPVPGVIDMQDIVITERESGAH